MFLRFLILCCLSLLGSRQLLAQFNALNPDKPIGKYILDHWTTEQGLPANALIDIVQTSDGYIWISSYNGLIRFDGVSFMLFNKANVPAFKANPVAFICETTQKELLISAENSGIVRFYKNRFDVLLSNNQINAPVQAILEGQNQKLWLGTQGKGLWLFDRKTNSLQAIEGHKLLSKASITALTFDNEGGVWIGTEKGLLLHKNGATIDFPPDSHKGLFSDVIQSLFRSQDGRVWIGTSNGLSYWNGKEFNKVAETENIPVRDLVQDKTGSLWISTQKGIFRYHEGYQKIEYFTDKDGLPHPDMRNLLVDHEQSLWLTSYRMGLIRFKNGKFTNYTKHDGLATVVANHICEWQPNKLLVGTDLGTVHWIDSGKVKPFPIQTPLVGDKRVKHLYKDSQNNLWVSTYVGVLKIAPDGKEELLKPLTAQYIRLVFESRDGTIWIGTRGNGLISYRSGVFKAYNKRNGFPSDFIMSITEDQEGNIWAGTNEAGLLCIDKNANVKQRYTLADGLGSNLVFNTYIDSQKMVWIASNNGFSVIDLNAKKIKAFSLKQGLPDENIFDILEDNSGNFWFASGKGILKIDKKSLLQYDTAKHQELNFVLYDKHDGMAQSECTGATASLKTSNGDLYFPTLGGVVMINPQEIPTNTIKPPVYTEDIVIDYETFNMPDSVLAIPAGKQRFVIEYTALSYIAPRKIKFKYKLEKFDQQWVDAHGERKAVYTNIAPGTYQFKVIASNNDGVWNEEGATLTIRVLPYFWQTTWFRLLAVSGFLLVLAGLIYWQLGKVQSKNAELEKMVAARTVEIQRKSDEILLKNSALEQKQEEILTQQEIVAESTQKLKVAFDEIQNKNLNIAASIQYAKRIQDAMLPVESYINQYLPESFVLFEPRDVVSGDFYWFAAIQNEATQTADKLIVAAADCTGHGVPGAFMAMAGNAFLNQIVNIQNITETGNILRILHLSIRNALKQGDSDNRDGMDIAICSIDLQERVLQFSGAQNPLLYVQLPENQTETPTNIEIQEIKGNKFPIGGNWGKNNEERNFETHTINLGKQRTICYLFSDGYQDQFGGAEDKKFSKKRLLALFNEICTLPLPVQRGKLLATLHYWKGNQQQLDDILIVGFAI